jgi:hypothetical protein
MSGGGVGIVLEAQPRVFASRSLKKGLFLNEEGFRADVVAHMVGEGNVMRGGNEIGGEEEFIRPIGHLDPLLSLRVSINSMNDEAGYYLRGALVECEFGVRERLYILGKIACSIFKGRIIGVVPVRLLKMDRRFWKGEGDSAIRCWRGNPTCVVEMKMRQDDIGY